MTGKQLRAFTHNMSGLYAHLFSNRYSSHVVQTLCAQIAKCIALGGGGVGNGGGAAVGEDGAVSVAVADAEDLVDCVVHIVGEVDEHFIEVVRDQSGSHALRTLTVVLNGFEPVAKKQFTTAQLKKQRQRKKKKKKLQGDTSYVVVVFRRLRLLLSLIHI